MNKNNKVIDDNIIPDCVNIKINETRNLIRKENIKKKRIKNTCLSVAAAAVVFLGISIVNPTLANKVPFLGNIINTMKQDNELSGKEPFIKNINIKIGTKINEKVISNDIGITVQDAYCDGSNIYVTYLIESENKRLDDMKFVYINDTVNGGDVMASFSNEKLSIDNTVSKKIDKNTYLIIQVIDLMPLVHKGVDVKTSFDLSINIAEVTGYKAGKRDKHVKGYWNYNIGIKTDDSKNIAYEPNLENNNAILKKVLLTPDTTEVEVDIPSDFGESAYVLAFDDKGKMLEEFTFSYDLESDLGKLQYKKFAPISQESEYILIKVVDKSKSELDVLSEFKVPLK